MLTAGRDGPAGRLYDLMGKASSTKKVARAARTGGKQTSQKRSLGFPVMLAGVVVLGIALVAFAAITNRDVSANTDRPRAQGQGTPSDHWHDAFGIDICGQIQAPVTDRANDVEGIHTHGDGVIHIHPFGLKSSGPRSTLGRFFDDTGLKVTSAGIKMPDGKVYKSGQTTCNGAPGTVTLAHWKDAQTAGSKPPDRTYTSGFTDIKLTEDGGAFTVAFLPKGAVPQPPTSAAKLAELGAADSGQTQSGSSGGSAGAATGGVNPATTGATGGVNPATTGATGGVNPATTGATGGVNPATTGATGATGVDPTTTGATTGTATTTGATTGTATTGTATTGTATTGTSPAGSTP